MKAGLTIGAIALAITGAMWQEDDGTGPLPDIVRHVEVPAAREEVWRAWTTDEGARTFFAPCTHIDATVGGPYEMYFLTDQPYGGRGGEGAQVHSLTPERELVFTWTAPPSVPEIRTPGLKTLVYVRLQSLGRRQTRVVLRQTGWGAGPAWAKVHAYFSTAWDVVLGRLKYRFEHGPIDWTRPPARTSLAPQGGDVSTRSRVG